MIEFLCGALASTCAKLSLVLAPSSSNREQPQIPADQSVIDQSCLAMQVLY